MDHMMIFRPYSEMGARRIRRAWKREGATLNEPISECPDCGGRIDESIELLIWQRREDMARVTFACRNPECQWQGVFLNEAPAQMALDFVNW